MTGRQREETTDKRPTSDETVSIARMMDEVADGWSDRDAATKLFRALCWLTTKHPERLQAGEETKEWGFEYVEVCEVVRTELNERAGLDWSVAAI